MLNELGSITNKTLPPVVATREARSWLKVEWIPYTLFDVQCTSFLRVRKVFDRHVSPTASRPPVSDPVWAAVVPWEFGSPHTRQNLRSSISGQKFGTSRVATEHAVSVRDVRTPRHPSGRDIQQVRYHNSLYTDPVSIGHLIHSLPQRAPSQA